jgi:hypothetical protein
VSFKQLPARWTYPLSRREAVRLFAHLDLQIDVRLLEFRGTAAKPTKNLLGFHCTGALDAHLSDEHWCYRLRLYGMPDAILMAAHRPVGVAISSEIETFVREREAERYEARSKDITMSLHLIERAAGLDLSCRTSLNEGWSRTVVQLDPWWLGSPAA